MDIAYCNNNTRAENDLKNIIRDIVSSISPAELRHLTNNFFLCVWNVSSSGRKLFSAPPLSMMCKNIVFTAVHKKKPWTTGGKLEQKPALCCLHVCKVIDDFTDDMGQIRKKDPLYTVQYVQYTRVTDTLCVCVYMYVCT
jgi:hypothetical protein